MSKKLLLVWESVPETTEVYVLDVDSEIGQAALGSAGLYINGWEEIPEDSPINTLNELLVNEESLSTDYVITGPFEKVVVCGNIL
ncbi:MAG: hypothetical protein P4L79_10365 [Legionella sp.]|uniref:hypothetical protein n=1 Tax=Legionella sp. TaxID=459 RepID=UPI00284BEDD7|nr:hypothetical protein [Legionella sp.]